MIRLDRPADSAGKNHSAATAKAPRGILTECAKGTVRTKGTYLSTRYHRINSRRGTRQSDQTTMAASDG